MPQDNSLEILYQALGTSIGLCVEVEDFSQAQAKFYAARRTSGDLDLDCLQFRRSPYVPDFELWIVKAQGTSTTTKQKGPSNAHT